jgi:uncharacterized protein (TIGR03435 family)
MPGPGEWVVHPGANNTSLHRFNLVNLSMGEFAQSLSSRLGRTIVDAAGMSGKYDFVLSCWVDMAPPRRHRRPETQARRPARLGANMWPSSWSARSRSSSD